MPGAQVSGGTYAPQDSEGRGIGGPVCPARRPGLGGGGRGRIGGSYASQEYGPKRGVWGVHS
jgi:hypothetical protein